MTKQTGGLTSAVKKLGSAIGAAFAVKQLVAFGKECVELGSNIAVVQNVVDTAFGDMTYKVEAFADTAIQNFGMSKLAAKKTASTYMAMAKGMGLADDVASDMSITLAGLTGDVASFYNISQELADTKLKSVFTGETETLKDLGIVMTQANLKAYALEQGITKDIEAMTQAELVGLRYNFVLDQLALANGDFAKTADSWANQTRVLSMQWQELMSIIGQALIQVLTPLVRVLNQIVSSLISVAQAASSVIAALFGGEAQVAAAGAVASEIATSVDNQNALTDATEATAKAQKKLLAGFDEINKLGSNSDSGSGSSGAAAIDVAPIAATIESGAKAAEKSGLLEYFQNLANALEPFGKAFETAFVDIQTGASRIKGTIAKVWEDIWGGILAAWDEHGAPIFDKVRENIGLTGEYLRSIWESTLQPIWENFMAVVDTLWSEHLKPLWDNFMDFVGTLIDGALEIYNKFILPMKTWFAQKIGVEIAKVINALISQIGNFLAVVADVASGIIDALKGMIVFIVGVFTGDWERAFSGLVGIFKGVINVMISIVESFVNYFVRALNKVVSAINSLSFDVPDWIPGIGGKTFGFNIPELSEIKLPRLAQGAVIPPNREFLAVLGDQKSGTNIETPLSTMIEAFRTAMRDMNIGGGQNEAYLVVDDEVLGKIVYRLYNKENRRVGVSLSTSKGGTT